MDITKELQQFNITDAAIAELKDKYMQLKIKGLDDKEGFKQVHEARMNVKAKRVEVTKAGRGLREEANAYNKAVLAEEKRILALLDPIETYLETEESRVKEEKERIKREAEEKEAARIKARADRLFKMGMSFNGTEYYILNLSISQDLVVRATDEQIDVYCERVQTAIDEHEKEETAKLQALEDERQRLLAIEAEQKKIADAQAEEARRLKEASDRLEAEKKAIEDAKKAEADAARRDQELETARQEAAEQARKAEALRIEREMAAKKAAEEKAKKDEERKAARAPDKEKLLHLATVIDAIEFPKLKTEEAKDILQDIGQDLMNLTKTLRIKAGAL